MNDIAAEISPNSPCVIGYDQTGLAHARTFEFFSAFRCLGFLHGRDRGQQMDYWRRMFRGQTAEISDYKSIATDMFMRLLALENRANEIYSTLGSFEKDLLKSYTEGVNKGFAGNFEAWQPRDSVSILLLHSMGQTREILTAKLRENQRLKRFGAIAESLFSATGTPWDTAIIKSEKASTSNVKGLDAEVSKGNGSNSWVIGPERSLSKRAILANDPHVELLDPPFWYFAHLQASNLNIAGASAPGVPLFLSGSNQFVAWGLTNAYLDSTEIYSVPKSELKRKQEFYPVVWFRFLGFKLPYFFKKLERTDEGWPILPLEELPEDERLILRWTGFNLKGNDVKGIFALAFAKTAEEFNKSLSTIGLSSWNFVFADIKQSIGFRAVGLIPERKQLNPYGTFVQDSIAYKNWGTTDISPNRMPNLINPKDNFIVTANNRHWITTSPHDGRYWDAGFRAFRIEELIRSIPKQDIKSTKKIQCDLQDVDARFIIPELLKVLTSDKRTNSAAIEILKDWNLEDSADCVACGLYHRWLDRMGMKHLLTETALYNMLTRSLTPKFLDIIVEEFQGALNDLHYSDKNPLPTWESIHHVYFDHPSDTLNPPPLTAISSVGSKNSVNVGFARWIDGEYRQIQGASHRMIIEMTSPPTMYFALAGPNRQSEKQSRSDPHSDWASWNRCEYQQIQLDIDWNSLKTETIKF